MVRSMTGYGRQIETVNGMAISVEIRSVNHRYFDYSSRIQRQYAFIDDKLKAYLQQRIARGKVDISVFIEATEMAGGTVHVNQALAAEYVRALKELAAEQGLEPNISLALLTRFSDVLTVGSEEQDEDAVWTAVRQVAAGAVDKFIVMRETEGAKMKADVLSRADTIEQAVAAVEERSPLLVSEYMTKLENRMKELLSTASVDEQRLLTEAALFADKTAVAEETVRLRSHIAQLRTMLSGEEAVGRKLDFLVQEMNREANTIGSKVQDVQLARVVVDIKSEIEKIREQIQNIE